MRVEIEAECVRTLERGAIDPSFGFSRRHRWKPLAFDIDDRAAVVVAQRGKRHGSALVTYTYEHTQKVWRLAGVDGVELVDRSLPPRLSEPGDWFTVLNHRGQMTPAGPRRLSQQPVILLLGQEVAITERHGVRTEVPDHGIICIAATGRSARVQLLDVDGAHLTTVTERDLSRPGPVLPWLVRLRMRMWLRREHAVDEWFNYASRT